MKPIKIIGTTALFLLFGIAPTVEARQEKQEEKAKPAQQEQQAKPEKQQQAKGSNNRSSSRPKVRNNRSNINNSKPRDSNNHSSTNSKTILQISNHSSKPGDSRISNTNSSSLALHTLHSAHRRQWSDNGNSRLSISVPGAAVEFQTSVFTPISGMTTTSESATP